jgi:hypothetical protein
VAEAALTGARVPPVRMPRRVAEAIASAVWERRLAEVGQGVAIEADGLVAEGPRYGRP